MSSFDDSVSYLDTFINYEKRPPSAPAPRSMGLELGDVAMVGDDVEIDVAGAQAAGAIGILVRTGKFQEVEVVARSGDRCHVRMHRCVYHEFFTELGHPEITYAICDSDQIFYDALFPEYRFDRNGSWKNTIAHGAPCCDYVWASRS